MSPVPPKPPDDIAAIRAQLPELQNLSQASFDAKAGEGYSKKLVDAIEMIGEETAAGMQQPAPHGQVTAGMRYLHCSRTIHQLVTDRNRAVGLFLGVASLLLTASGVIIHANPGTDLIIPIAHIQRWCLPIAFGTLTVLALLIGFLLIRTRVGLIYEVAKMNALLGLPVGRVSRIQPLSIFFIMQTIISLGGGACPALFSVFLLASLEVQHFVWPAVLIGVGIAVGQLVLYMVAVVRITSDQRLEKVGQ